MKTTLLYVFFLFLFIFNIGLLAQSEKTLDKILPFTDCYSGERISESFVVGGEKNEAAYEMMSVILQQNTQGRAYNTTLTTLIKYIIQEIPRSLQITDLESELQEIVAEKTIYNNTDFQSKKNEMACIVARFLHEAYLKYPKMLEKLPKHYDFYTTLQEGGEVEASTLGEQLLNINDKRNDIILFYNTLTVALVIIVLIFLFIFWLKNRQILAEEDIDRKIATAVNEENNAVKAMNQKIADLEKQQKNQNKLLGNAENKGQTYTKQTKELIKKEITKKMSNFYEELDERMKDIETKIARKIDVLKNETLKEQELQNDLFQNVTTEKELKKELDVFRQDLIAYFEKRYATPSYAPIPEHIDNENAENKYIKTMFFGVPTPDGMFLQSRMANAPTQDAFYQLSVLTDNPMEAEFTLVNNTEWLHNAFARKKTHILSACKTTGPRNFKKILKLEKGIAAKDGNNWRIKTMAKVLYV